MTKRETCEDKQDDPVVPSCQKNQEAADFWRCKAGVNASCCRTVTVCGARCGSLRLGMAREEIMGRESETEREGVRDRHRGRERQR